jgi:hypothetical protein
MRFQKSQPAEATTYVQSSASTCPLKKYECIIPRTKNARSRIARKSWQHFEHLRSAMARTGRYKKETRHKAGVRRNRPRVQC